MSHRADPRSAVIADRHYNRQKIGSPQFVPPGRCLVLRAENVNAVALWVTSWPFGEYVRHAWPGAWVCSCFRNEGAGLSSVLIRSAVAATRHHFGEPPENGMVTFVNPAKIRRKRDPGRCYRRAGFIDVGRTVGGLIALQLRREDMPPAEPAIGAELSFDTLLSIHRSPQENRHVVDAKGVSACGAPGGRPVDREVKL